MKRKIGFSTILMLAIFSLFTIGALAAAPAKPEVTSKLVGPNKLEISWKAVPGATSYNVYWNGATQPESTTELKYVKENLNPTSYYRFAVSAVNADGESEKVAGDQAFMHGATVKSDGTIGTHRTHGDFQNNTNSCANCHSTHTGKDERLLKYTNGEYEMCMSCHDGTLGFYNVLSQGEGAGTFNDTHESASMHNVKSDAVIGQAPGASTAVTSTLTLECSSCHNPHGSVNDRLLKETISTQTSADGKTHTAVKWSSTVDKGTKAIALDLTPDPAYAEFNASTGANGLKIMKSTGPKDGTNAQNYAQFCGACHDNYKTSRTTAYTNKNDGQSYHTHNAATSSAGRNCASCHFAHGTDVTLMIDTQGKTVADYVKEGWTEERAVEYMKDVNKDGSKLKKYTNMSVCWACHQSSHALDTQQPDSKYLIDGTDRYGNPIKVFPGKPAK